MPDPIGLNAVLQTVADAYRVFQQEMRNIRIRKIDLIRSIVGRVDAESIDEARKDLIRIPYASEK